MNRFGSYSRYRLAKKITIRPEWVEHSLAVKNVARKLGKHILISAHFMVCILIHRYGSYSGYSLTNYALDITWLSKTWRTKRATMFQLLCTLKCALIGILWLILKIQPGKCRLEHKLSVKKVARKAGEHIPVSAHFNVRTNWNFMHGFASYSKYSL